jgi:hypothetical protein
MKFLEMFSNKSVFFTNTLAVVLMVQGIILTLADVEK